MNLWPKCLHRNNKTDLVTRLTQVKQVEHLLTDEQPRSKGFPPAFSPAGKLRDDVSNDVAASSAQRSMKASA